MIAVKYLVSPDGTSVGRRVRGPASPTTGIAACGCNVPRGARAPNANTKRMSRCRRFRGARSHTSLSRPTGNATGRAYVIGNAQLVRTGRGNF